MWTCLRRGSVGTWRARAADDELRRDGIGLDVDDTAWARSPCPDTGDRTPAFAGERRADPLPPPLRAPLAPARQRRWITFDGIFYQADVWLDGAYLGDPEGYFFPHSFDITALVAPG